MLLSIIIPVYNAGKTIERALNSIFSQTFNDYEVIIVDDGSTDETQICLKKYIECSGLIHVYSIKNGGPANARNVGIDVSKGKYILFMDSDDMLAENALEQLIPTIEKYDVDMLIYGYTITNVNLEPLKDYRMAEGFYSDQEELGQILPDLYQRNLLNQVWNKIYRAEIIKTENIRFQDYKYGEDRLFVFDALEVMQRIQVVDSCYYYYITNSEGSLITKYYDKKFDCCCLIDRRIRDLAVRFKCLTAESAAVYDYMFMKSVISCIVQLYDSSCHLDYQQKRESVCTILNHPQLGRKSNINVHFGLSFIVLRTALRTHCIWLNMFIAWGIASFSKRYQTFFIRLKHRN